MKDSAMMFNSLDPSSVGNGAENMLFNIKSGGAELDNVSSPSPPLSPTTSMSRQKKPVSRSNMSTLQATKPGSRASRSRNSGIKQVLMARFNNFLPQHSQENTEKRFHNSSIREMKGAIVRQKIVEQAKSQQRKLLQEFKETTDYSYQGILQTSKSHQL